MEWNQIEGQWDIIKGEVKTKWGKLTDDNLMQIKGKKESLIGHIKQAYGYAKEEAEKQILAQVKTTKKATKTPTKKSGK